MQFCSECGAFPCTRLQQLENATARCYHMSMIENLHHMKMHGMKGLLEREEEKWKCPKCGGTISCHNGICYSCGIEELKRLRKYASGLKKINGFTK